MFSQREPREYHGAIVDLTDHCNPHCRHCFYYRKERESRELPNEQLLQRLGTLRDRHNIRSMEWCGGELACERIRDGELETADTDLRWIDPLLPVYGRVSTLHVCVFAEM